MLRALHGITGRHAHVFPGHDDRARPMAVASFRQALNVLGWGGMDSPMPRAPGAARDSTKWATRPTSFRAA